jgi:hypothetical protein
MNTKHNDTKQIFNCDHCDCTYTTLYNLKRHMVKHTNEEEVAPNINVVAPNINVVAPNINVDTQNINVVAPNINVDTQNISIFKCLKCAKEFSRKYNLQRHEQICNGIADKMQCYLCQRKFNTRQAKSQHLKICMLHNKNKEV